MKVTVLTLFPQMFEGPFSYSIIKRAQEKGLVEITFVNIRDFGIGPHQMVDDTPYGGGVGMVLRVDILDKALESVKDKRLSNDEQKVILMDTHGPTFVQQKAIELSHLKHLIILCGHYEGVDERAKDLIDEQISIGDFVTTGGEIPTMLIIDSVVRLIPGVLKEAATQNESYTVSPDYLEHPHYTKPRVYKGKKVPEVLTSGNHKEIEKWKEDNKQKKSS